ncbi:enhancer of mRNA-decapping protein 4 homolog Ge-1 isoform X3 [Haemaphysalis longicornis]
MPPNGVVVEGAEGGLEHPPEPPSGNLLDEIFPAAQEPPEPQEPPEQPEQPPQHISLLDQDEELSVAVCGKVVQVVVGGARENASSSNRMKIKNIVDYSWGLSYNIGKHIALHMSKTYLAYALRTADSSAGVVRVLNLQTGVRVLLRGFRGLIRDMAFARLMSPVLIAVVDAFGTLCVYEVHNSDKSTLWLKVERPAGEPASEHRRVVWCPYVPDDARGGNGGDDEASKVLAATNLEEAEVWNLAAVVAEHGMGCTLTVPDVRVGLQRIIEHTGPIIDACFSPDGTALAIAGADGQVRFFQVYMQEPDVTPRCLHRWCPHDEKPVSCLIFLDNIALANADGRVPLFSTQFWRYALTGTDNNTELKLWNCERWTCLQTIRFIVPPGDTAPPPAFKVEVDPSANYIVLSDIHRKVVYVCQLKLDHDAELVSLALFPVVAPVLNFAVVEARRCRFKPSTNTEQINRLEGPQGTEVADEDHTSEVFEEGIMVQLHWMSTRSVQSCHIVYPATASSTLSPADSLSTLSQNSGAPGYTDPLSDLSTDTDDDDRAARPEQNFDLPSNTEEGSGDDPAPSSPGSSKVLLKPSDFVSPSNQSSRLVSSPGTASTDTETLLLVLSPDQSTNGTPTPVPSHICDIPVVTSSLGSPGTANGVRSQEEPEAGDHLVTEKLDTEDPLELPGLPQRKLSQRSTASSSSQEVADIMAPAERLANASHSTDEEEEEEEEFEELDIGPDYDGALEDSLFAQGGAANRSSATLVAAPEGASEDAAWPQPPDSSDGYPGVAAPAGGCDEGGGLYQAADGQGTVRVLGELELLASQQLEETSSLAQSVAALSAQCSEQSVQLQALLDRRSCEDSIFASLVAESRAHRALLSRLEVALQELGEAHKAGLEKQMGSMAETIGTILAAHLERTTAAEVKNSVVPTVAKILDLTRCDISRRLETTEVFIRESLAKAVKSKVVTEAVTQAVHTAVQTNVQTACREILQNTLVPSVERLCQNLFLQVNETFQKGTREFLQQSRHLVEKQSEARVEELVKAVQVVVESSLQGFLHEHQAALAPPDLRVPLVEATAQGLQGLQATLLQALSSQQEVLAAGLRQDVQAALRESVAAAAAEGAAAAARSSAATPIPLADPHLVMKQITQLLRQGHYNMAFQQALSVADLSTVVTTCELVTPETIFGQYPCPLQQPVLLSLIQQLCADLTSNSDIKLKFLEEAVLSLDKDNAVTKEHVAVILTQLCQKLNKFLLGKPSHELGRSAKRLHLVAQSLLAN